jgi:hypothetical protein
MTGSGAAGQPAGTGSTSCGSLASPPTVPAVGPTPVPLPPVPGPANGRVGMTIDDGAQYTSDPEVTLSVIRPSWADSIRVDNAGASAIRRRPRLGPKSPWKLASSGPERLPKTVYIRFGTEVQTFQDDSILHQTAPAIQAAAAHARGRVQRKRRRLLVRRRSATACSSTATDRTRRRSVSPCKAQNPHSEVSAESSWSDRPADRPTAVASTSRRKPDRSLALSLLDAPKGG